MLRTLIILVFALLLAVAPSHAAEPPSTDEIVVVGERPGPRLWRIEGPQGEVFVLGVLTPLPKSFTWKTKEIDAVIARADRVFAGGSTVSVGIGALIANRKAFRNPDGAKTSALLDPDTRRNFDAARSRYDYSGDDLENWRPYVAGLFLMDKAMTEAGLSRSLDPEEVTLKKVRKRRIDVTVVTRIEAKPLLKALAAMPAGADAPCLAAELQALDAMPVMRERALAWAKGDIERLRALGDRDEGAACMNSLTSGGVAAATIRETLTVDWTRALSNAAGQKGVTLAIAPMGVLLAADGVLARLRAQGVQIDGP
jgi:uncharacterized protein YbaP (TraB family)